MKIGKNLSLSHFALEEQVDNLAEELEDYAPENTRVDLSDRLDKFYDGAGSALTKVMPRTGREGRREYEFDKLWKRRVHARRLYTSKAV